jgi:hypothetical protein
MMKIPFRGILVGELIGADRAFDIGLAALEA